MVIFHNYVSLPEGTNLGCINHGSDSWGKFSTPWRTTTVFLADRRGWLLALVMCAILPFMGVGAALMGKAPKKKVVLVGGLEHLDYFPFHIWVVILPIDSYFSRWLLHLKPPTRKVILWSYWLYLVMFLSGLNNNFFVKKQQLFWLDHNIVVRNIVIVTYIWLYWSTRKVVVFSGNMVIHRDCGPTKMGWPTRDFFRSFGLSGLALDHK